MASPERRAQTSRRKSQSIKTERLIGGGVQKNPGGAAHRDVGQIRPVDQVRRDFDLVTESCRARHNKLESAVVEMGEAAAGQESQAQRNDTNIVQAQIAWVVAETKLQKGIRSVSRDKELRVDPTAGSLIDLIENHASVPSGHKFVRGRPIGVIQPERKQI